MRSSDRRRGELDGVDKKVYWEVVDNCYLCDMCFMTKCPYVPPHPWNVDFPHLMLRAKAVRARADGLSLRERTLAATDTVGALAGIPVVAEIVNAVNRLGPGRVLLEKMLGVDRNAPLPNITRAPRASAWRTWGRPRRRRSRRRARRRLRRAGASRSSPPATATATSRSWLRTWRRSSSTTASRWRCCRASAAAACRGWSSGDLEGVAKLKEYNIPQLAQAVDGRLRHGGADSLLRADVQAGAAADVPRGCRRCAACARISSIRSST